MLYMKNILLPAMLLLSASLYAQKDFTVRLWPDGAPLSNGLTGPEEGWDCLWVRNISDPDMRVFLPEKSNGMAVLVCPGGGYEFLAMNHEGLDMVPWFNEQGITMILLKYRMPNGHSEIPLSDAAQAMRLTRMNARSEERRVGKEC